MKLKFKKGEPIYDCQWMEILEAELEKFGDNVDGKEAKCDFEITIKAKKCAKRVKTE